MDLKNEDNNKNEDNLKNEDDLKNEYASRKWNQQKEWDQSLIKNNNVFINTFIEQAGAELSQAQTSLSRLVR